MWSSCRVARGSPSQTSPGDVTVAGLSTKKLSSKRPSLESLKSLKDLAKFGGKFIGVSSDDPGNPLLSPLLELLLQQLLQLFTHLVISKLQHRDVIFSRASFPRDRNAKFTTYA